MTSINQNDTFYANNKRVLKFTVTDKDADPEAPLDLTGMVVRWALSKFLANGNYSTEPILLKDNDSEGGVSVTDAEAGEVEVSIEPEDTGDLSGKFYQELEAVDVTGDPVVIATGTLTIKKNVRNSI